MFISRKRSYYLLLIIGVIILGLLSREFSGWLPKWTGDILWGLMVFFLMGFIFGNGSTRQSAILATAFSLGIEAAKLYHAPWIDTFRYTRTGGLILGYVFSWSNIFCYITGIAVGIMCEGIWLKIREK